MYMQDIGPFGLCFLAIFEKLKISSNLHIHLYVWVPYSYSLGVDCVRRG